MRIALAALFTIALIWVIKPTDTPLNLHKQTELTDVTNRVVTPTTADQPHIQEAAKVQPQPVAQSTPVVASAPAPSEPSPPSTTGSAYASGCSTYASTFEQYSWNVSIAIAICEAESGGNPYAESDTDDDGIMQIHLGEYLYGSQIFNPVFNIAVAYKKYERQGWEAWTTYNSGAYLRFLD